MPSLSAAGVFVVYFMTAMFQRTDFPAFRLSLVFLPAVAQAYLFFCARRAIHSSRLPAAARRPAVAATGAVICLLFLLNALYVLAHIRWVDPPAIAQVLLFYVPAVWALGSVFTAVILGVAHVARGLMPARGSGGVVPRIHGRRALRAQRDEILKGLPEAFGHAKFALDLLKGYHKANLAEVEDFASFDSNYMGLVQPDGALELYDGNLRFCNAAGEIVHDQVPPSKYLDYISEAVEPWSYMKFPFISALGYPQGMYRVGPLARLNACSHIATPLADAELKVWRAKRRVQTSSFYYHWARLIELLYGLERAQQLLESPDITSTDILVPNQPTCREGVGVIEAPRGTLIHHYWVDADGRVEKANLIVATGHNNLAMNRGVQAIARKYVKAKKLKEGMLNRVEAVIRCYDPCLSCATHAMGQMPMQVELVDAGGTVLQTLQRDSTI